MKAIHLALALALTGGTLAAPAGSAEEEGAPRHEPSRLVEQNRHLAAAAQRESAATAADALRDAAKTDLDIQLTGHTSVLIAGDFQKVH